MDIEILKEQHGEMLKFLERIAKTNIGRPSQLCIQFENFQEEVQSYLLKMKNPPK